MPHRDGSSRSSAGLDVSAPAILSYRPLSEGGERFMKQMAADDVTPWAGPTP